MKKYKVIDFRCRPPMAAQKLIFDLKLGRLKWANKFICPPSQATLPSMFKVGTDEGIDLLYREMDEAGIDLIVVPGRNLSNPPKAVVKESDNSSLNVTDSELAELKDRYQGRAIGMHGIDAEQPAESIVSGIETAISEYGLSGAVLEIGYSVDEQGKPLQLNDRRLYPIYETMIKLDKPLMLQSGIYAGHDIDANNWPPLDRVMQDFPGLKMILAHGGYPRILDAIALCVKHPNLYISPDIYCFFPGGRLYIEAISQLPDQFLFGTAYPFGTFKESLELTYKFPLSEEVMEKYLYGNAARLLEI
ncbi:MAG: amidohydrolase family protein [Deltaproteobacteria bacterium]|nr:amidohydrolase family protein [Deltaproteobacteria bacterium]